MFTEIFERHENEVKECGLKTVNEVRASNFLAEGGRRISRNASAQTFASRPLFRFNDQRMCKTLLPLNISG